MGPIGILPPIKIKAVSFLPGTNPLSSFRGLQDVPIFAGNTYKYRSTRNYG